MEMKLACQGCCFRVEVELFGPALDFRRYDLVPRRSRFQIERGLRRRLAKELRRRTASTEASESPDDQSNK